MLADFGSAYSFYKERIGSMVYTISVSSALMREMT